MEPRTVKIVVIGDNGAGKTSSLISYVVRSPLSVDARLSGVPVEQCTVLHLAAALIALVGL